MFIKNKIDKKNENPNYDKSLDSKKAFRYCIHLIAKKDYSIFKLSQKLSSKKYQQIIVDECIQKLIKLEYLQEDNYTRVKIRSLARRGYGKRYIMQKCHEEKLIVDEVLIDEIYEENNLDEYEILQYQVKKRTRNIDLNTMPNEMKRKHIEKIMRSLITRGFNYNSIKELL